MAVIPGATTATTTAPPPLDARSLYRFFHAGDEEVLALRGVSLHANRGEMVAVTGPSGSGKSTLLACLAGVDEPDGGTVYVGGERLSRRTEADRTRLRAAKIGMLFQTANLIEHLDVAGNVSLVQRLAGRRAKHAGARSEHLLDSVGIVARARARPSQLSGGELARAGLAVALANDPAILLADEPTGELDQQTESQVIALLRAEADAGRAVVLVTHSLALAAVADRTVALSDGAVAS